MDCKVGRWGVKRQTPEDDDLAQSGEEAATCLELVCKTLHSPHSEVLLGSRGQEIHSCPEFLQLPGGPMAPTCGWHHPGLPPLRATQHSPTPLRGPAQKAEFWSWSGHTSAGRGTWARRRSRVTGVHIIPWPLPHRISVRPVLLPGPSPV